MSLAFIRHLKSKQFNLFNLTSTVVTTTAGINGTAINVSGFREGIFHNYMTLNTSGAPAIYLDTGIVPYGLTTTVWAQYATIDADFTTTANNTSVAVEFAPTFLRGRIPVLTTTASVTTMSLICDVVMKT